MILRLLSALVAIVFVVSSVTVAQDPKTLQKEAQQKAQTEAQKKAETEAQQKAQTEAQKKAEMEAQKKAQTEAQKKAQTEAEQKARTETQKKEQGMEKGPMKSFNCPAPCNFKVQSRDEQEVVDASAAHLKKHHNTTLSEKEIKSKMKTEGTKEKGEQKKETAPPKKEKPKQ